MATALSGGILASPSSSQAWTIKEPQTAPGTPVAGLQSMSPLPKAFAPSSVILFQGDSITDGGRWTTGMDYNHIMGQDYCYIIAGKMQSEYPDANLNFVNRGVSGNTVKDLADRWQIDTIDLKPSLVSVLVGVNDAMHTLGRIAPAEAGANYRQVYEALITQTTSALPGVQFVLGQPFVLPVGARLGNFADWKAQVRAMREASESLALKYDLPYVRYGEMFDAASKRASPDHWTWDGIHPTYAGHYLMHSLWLETVMAFYG